MIKLDRYPGRKVKGRLAQGRSAVLSLHVTSSALLIGQHYGRGELKSLVFVQLLSLWGRCQLFHRQVQLGLALSLDHAGPRESQAAPESGGHPCGFQPRQQAERTP